VPRLQIFHKCPGTLARLPRCPGHVGHRGHVRPAVPHLESPQTPDSQVAKADGFLCLVHNQAAFSEMVK
jgi:hypothetical protein